MQPAAPIAEMQIVRAQSDNLKMRLGLVGPAGSGKTFTALELCTMIGPTLIVDTEGGTSRYYARDGLEFDMIQLDQNYTLAQLQEVMNLAQNYDCVIIDSFSSWWNGHNSIHETVAHYVEIQEIEAKRNGGNANPNTMPIWGKVKREQWQPAMKLINSAPNHVVLTMRSSNNVQQVKNERGRTRLETVGIKPEQDERILYELDTVFYMQFTPQDEVVARCEKARCKDIRSLELTNPKYADFSPYLQWLKVLPPTSN